MLQGLQGMSQGCQTAAPSSYAQTQRPDSVSPLRLPTVETETEQICKMLQGVSQGSQKTATAAEPLSYRQKTQRPDSVSPLRLPTVEIQAERRSCSPLRFEVLQNFQLARQKALAAVLTDGPDTSRGDNRTPKYAVMGASARGGGLEQEGRGRSGKERRQKLSSDILDEPVEFDRGPLPERESRRRHGANEPVAATFSRAQAEGASFAGRSLSPRRPGPLAAIAARYFVGALFITSLFLACPAARPTHTLSAPPPPTPHTQGQGAAGLSRYAHLNLGMANFLSGTFRDLGSGG